MKQFAILLLFSAAAYGQLFGGGIKVGAPLTDALSAVNGAPIDTSITNGHYTIGPYGEVRLPGGFSVEIDALYRSFGSSYLGSMTNSGGNWEFPVLAKEKFLKGPVRPYVEGGLLLSHLTGSDIDIAHASNYGVTVGGGVEIHAHFLRISPEIRYDGFVFHDFANNSFVQSNRNQVLVLVGVGF